MSVQLHDCDAVLSVAGVKSELSLQVRYIVLPAFPETQLQPAEPRQVEILSIWHGEHVMTDGVLSQAQMEAIGDEILGNQ